ncbi:hypothetical protein ACFSSA_02570 [Luteolibacter algae]|uniref:Multidrug resistance protein MdtA-like C-terminal permuted SH3 domain-containing protein n=1 Tax=Luteolibacter algae TaxID=454151 RepID=A0ABW5D3C4_9BACT
MICFKYLAPALFILGAHAGELTLEPKPFHVLHQFSAVALPAESVPVRLDPEKWGDFEIVSIAAHGSTIKMDQPLLVFDTKEIDKTIAQLRESIAEETLEIAEAEQELAGLEATLPEHLARLKRGADKAKEELAYFKSTRRKNLEEGADQSLKRQEQILASYKEELRQLLQMYEADDITEDTEEIILQKQRDAVASAEFALRMEVLDHKRTLELAIPQQLTALTERDQDATFRFEEAKKQYPRDIELKKLELAGLRKSLGETEQDLASLEKDRKLFEIKAPADGIFYFGAIENGKWITGDLIKNLSATHSAPLGKTFATFIPTNAKLIVQAFPDQDTARALTLGAAGSATLDGTEETLIPVTLSRLEQMPHPDETYPAVFTPAWPAGFNVYPGQSMQVRIVSYQAEKVISVPSKAIEFGTKGWAVEVKLADGKTEMRPVSLGKTSAGNTEITAGLEAGQVIIIP